MQTQDIILNQLIHNEDFYDKVLPFMKAEFFEGEQNQIVFGLIDSFSQTYNSRPTAEAIANMATEMKIPEGVWEKVVEVVGVIETPLANQDFKYLLDTSEKWMVDRAVFNVIMDSVDIYSNGTRRGELGSIAPRMEEALALSFETDIGMVYWEMAGLHYDRLHGDQARIPFLNSTLNDITDGGCWVKTLNAINAGINVGKAQPLSSKLLTPTGWKLMGDIKVGDFVIGRNGEPTRVAAVYPQGVKQITELRFWDGRKTRCCDEHLWNVYKGGSTEPPVTIDTKEFMRLNNLKKYASKNNRLYIDLPEPVKFIGNDLEIPPYMLGVLLGDGGYTERAGGCTITSIDNEILSKFEDLLLENFDCVLSAGVHDISYRVVKSSMVSGVTNNLVKEMKEMGIYGKYSYEKTIPEKYLFASVEDRLELLRGLMDTDGYVSENASCDYSTSSKGLALGVIELVRSLGGMAKLSHRKVEGFRDAYVVGIRFRPDIDIFSLSRKLERHNVRKKPLNVISVESIEYVGEEECQCIMVEDPEHLYVTDDFVVTHNTTALIDLAVQYASQGLDVVYFTFEVTEDPLRHRMDCRVLNRPFSVVKSLARPEYVAMVEKEFKKGIYGNIFIKEFPSGGAHAGHCRSYIKDLIKRRGVKPKVIMFDYLGEMASERLPVSLMGQTDLYQGSIARELRALAMEFESINWTALQFQRGMQNTREMDLTGNADSITVPKVLDFQLGLSVPDELAALNQAFGTVMKSRYSNKSVKKNFLIGLDNDYQKMYDLEGAAVTGANDPVHRSHDNSRSDSEPGAPKTKPSKYQKLDNNKVNSLNV